MRPKIQTPDLNAGKLFVQHFRGKLKLKLYFAGRIASSLTSSRTVFRFSLKGQTAKCFASAEKSLQMNERLFNETYYETF